MTACPRCGAPTETVLHSAPAFAGEPYARCADLCGWEAQP